VMSVAKEVLNAEASSIFTVDEDTGELLFYLIQGGADEQHIKCIRLQPGEGIVGHVVKTGEPLIVNDVANDSRWCSKADDESGFETRSILCVPLRTKDRIWGALEILNKCEGDFSEEDLTLCRAVAGQAAIALENAMLHGQVVQAERMAAIGQTVTGMAHCIKNILSNIRGGSYVVDLGFGAEDEEKIRKGWEMVKRNSLFMEELVLDMLTYSKERKPEYAPVDANTLVQEICEMMQNKAEQRGVSVEWTLCKDLGEVTIDEKGIRRSLLNLVSNAVDACQNRDERRVDVATETMEDDRFAIHVSDTGCGIKPENLPKLFRMFFSTKGSKGTGFGLAVTHKIVDEHGGKLDVVSELGSGSTFTVLLPTHPATPATDA